MARLWTEIELARLLSLRALSKIIKGEKNWPEVPFAKLQWSSLAQTLAELAVDLLGPAGVLAQGGPDAVDRGKWTRLYAFQRYSTIGGGSTEIQKNIIADRAITLPGKSRSTLALDVRAESHERRPPRHLHHRGGPPHLAPGRRRRRRRARAARPCGRRWPAPPPPTPGVADPAGSWPACERHRRRVLASPGSTTTPPARLAERLGADPARRRYSGIGGSVPLVLAADAARARPRDGLDLALLVGAEALATVRRLKKAGAKPQWSFKPAEKRPFPMDMTFDPSEVSHAVFEAYLTFALFDNARRAHLGRALGAHRARPRAAAWPP